MAIDLIDTVSTDVQTILPQVDSGGTPPNLRQNGDGGNGGGGSNRSAANAVVAMLLFLGADLMFFAGFIGAFMVFRFGAEAWPPPGQPRLPLNVTTANTLILLLSGITMAATLWFLRKRSQAKVMRGLFLTTFLGIIFLTVQGYEWVRLVKFGLTITHGVFGSTFYTLIGCHGLHVAGAVLWLFIILIRHRVRAQVNIERANLGIRLASMYWFLVVALWPVLFVLVYLD